MPVCIHMLCTFMHVYVYTGTGGYFSTINELVVVFYSLVMNCKLNNIGETSKQQCLVRGDILQSLPPNS